MSEVEDEMRAEYKHADFVNKAFPSSEGVNQALRGLLALADETTGRSKLSPRKRAAV